jgi:hypothetical protein
MATSGRFHLQAPHANFCFTCFRLGFFLFYVSRIGCGRESRKKRKGRRRVGSRG